MTTGLVPAQINYAVVELLHKNADINTKPELGLFRGLRLRTEKQTTEAQPKVGLLNLILLGQTGQNNSLNGFSHDFYKVMSIRLGYGTTKEFLIFKQSDDEQKQAVEILGAILESLRLDKKMLENDSEIVDLDKYKDLPYDLEKATSTTDTSRAGVGGVYNNYGNRNVSTANTDWEKKRKEEEAEKARQEKLRYTPYLIKRVGELPTSQTIQAMKKKVMDLASGEYEGAPLPIAKEKITQTAGTEADADDEPTTKTAPPPPPTVYQGE